MANSDRDVEYMRETWGTTKLVTDYGSLETFESGAPTKESTNYPPKDRLEKFCGGRGGFDDYIEWWE